MFIKLSREKLRNPNLSDVVWSACEELSRQGVQNFIHKATESKPTIIELFNPPARMTATIDFVRVGVALTIADPDL